MNATGNFLRDRLVNAALPFHPRQARERYGNDPNTEMRFTSVACPGMTGMARTLVADDQFGGLKGRFQFVS